MDRDLIDTICVRVRGELTAEAPLVEEFVRRYYGSAHPADHGGRSAADLYAQAVALWTFVADRSPGTTKLRVHNPTLESDGWPSVHTVVEIATDDMPFLVDSVTMELNRLGYGIQLILHPVLAVRRDQRGRAVDLMEPGAPAESVIHVEVDRQTDASELEILRGHLARVLGDVRAAVEDWPAMRAQGRQLIAELDELPPPLDAGEVEEAKALIAWLDDRHFIFLGYREYDLVAENGEQHLRAKAGSGLGILRDGGPRQEISRAFAALPARVRARARASRVLNLTRANSRATVHRPSYLDYVGINRFGPSGEVVGERRFLGLYTTAADKQSPGEIPVLRRKVETVLSRADFPPDGHNEKALIDLLEEYPREELFQIHDDELFDIATGILALGERQRLRVFVRADEYERFLSCLVFLPRERFNTANRERIGEILRGAFNAETVDFAVRLSESVLVRILFTVRIPGGGLPAYAVDEIEARIAAATRSWTDDLRDVLLMEQGGGAGQQVVPSLLARVPGCLSGRPTGRVGRRRRQAN